MKFVTKPVWANLLVYINVPHPLTYAVNGGKISESISQEAILTKRTPKEASSVRCFHAIFFLTNSNMVNGGLDAVEK